MSARSIAGTHASDFNGTPVIREGDDPADRANKANARGHVQYIVFGNGIPAIMAGRFALKQFRADSPFFTCCETVPLAFRIRLFVQSLNGRVVLFCEALGRFLARRNVRARNDLIDVCGCSSSTRRKQHESSSASRRSSSIAPIQRTGLLENDSRRLESAPSIIQSGISSRRFREESRPSTPPPFLEGTAAQIQACADANGDSADASDNAHALRDTDGAARIQQVEQVRALQHLIVSRQAPESCACLRRSRTVGEAAAPRASCSSNSCQSAATSAISKL